MERKSAQRQFVVTIIGRENATWQGTITWVDTNITQLFKSTLELIRLIDSSPGGNRG